MKSRLIQAGIVLIFLIASILYALSLKETEAEKKDTPVILTVRPIVLIIDKKEVIETIEETVVEIDDAEVDLLAHLIFAEAGSDWCEDNMLYYTGSVVLNRIESEYFPNTMREVIYQPGQYSCISNGMIDYEYNQRAYNVAEDLLMSGSCLPKNVLFQAQCEQGDGTYVKVQNMYFCYKGE